MVNVEDFRIFANEVYDDIVDCGFTKPLSRLLITDKVDVVQSVALHHVLLKTLGELSQFRDGLEPLKIGKTLEQYGGLLRDFFVIKESEVTAGGKIWKMWLIFCSFFSIDYVRKVFKKIRFSEEGSNAFAKEQNSYMMFLEYLDECEKGKLTLSLLHLSISHSHGPTDQKACVVLKLCQGLLQFIFVIVAVTSRVSVREMCEDKEDKTATTNACK